MPVSAASDIFRMPMISDRGFRVFPVWWAGQTACAPAALGAGEAVEDVLPGEVGQGPDPEDRVLALEVHRGQHPARLELAEPDVDEARVDVEVLVLRDVDEEGGEHDHVRPPQDDERGVGRILAHGAQRDGQGVGDERSWDWLRHRLEGLGEQLRRDDQRDEREDDQGRPREQQALRPRHQPAQERPRHGDEREHRDHVLERDQERPEDAVQRPADDGLGDAAEHEVDVADQQDR